MAKRVLKNAAGGRARTSSPRARLALDQAIIAVLIAAMDANDHVSREEAWRAHHIIWSMRRFRSRAGENVDRLIDTVRTRMVERGKDVILREAVDALPLRIRPSAFAVAADLMLADARLEPAEKRFVKQLALELKLDPGLADDLVRAMVIKNSA